jgi:hypothetical protein
MFENERAKLQLQARYAGPDSEAIFGLNYDIISIQKKTKRQRKNQRYRTNLKTKALATSGGLGVSDVGD